MLFALLLVAAPVDQPRTIAEPPGPRPQAANDVIEYPYVSPRPPIPRAATIAIAAISVAAFGVGAGFGIDARMNYSKWGSLVNQSAVTQMPISGVQLRQIENRVQVDSLVANASFISGGVLLLGAGLMALFTDWTPPK